jgi:hypothetical protein
MRKETLKENHTSEVLGPYRAGKCGVYTLQTLPLAGVRFFLRRLIYNHMHS